MKLEDVKQVTEMAKTAQVCANCGQPKASGHYYYKGGFKCKGTGKSFAAADGSGAPVAGPVPSAQTPKFGEKSAEAAANAVAPAAPVATAAGPNIKDAMAKWLKTHNVDKFKINEDGFVDVDGEVRLDDMRMPRLPGPVKFGTVTGDFICSSTGLTTLAGCPQHVGTSEFGGDFMADYNEIASLEGSPKTVGGSFSCTGCQNLDSLQHMSEKVGGNIFAQNLEKVKTLQGIHKIVRQCGGIFDLSGTKLESHVLGLLMIKGLESVKLENTQVAEIINKHLKQPDRNAHECQEELIDAGFAAFAKL